MAEQPLSPPQMEAIAKAIAAVATATGGAFGFAKWLMGRRPKADQRLIEHELRQDDLALDVAEGLRHDVAALQTDYKELFVKLEGCQAAHLDCERRIVAAEQRHGREMIEMERRMAGLERRIDWDGTTERRRTEEI